MLTTQIGTVKDWHNPRDESCPHNENVERGCTCKRPCNRKPYRRVAVNDNGVGHRVNPHLIFEIYRDGTVILREKGRKKRFAMTAATIYRIMMQRAALAYLAAKRKARAERRKARKAVRRDTLKSQ